MEGILQQFTGYPDGKSALDYCFDDTDVMGVYLMSLGDPSKLLPFDKNKGIPNQGLGIPNYKQPEQNINITTGLSTPQNYSVPKFTTHELGKPSHHDLPKPQKHIPNINQAKYNPQTQEVQPKKSVNLSIRSQINKYLDGKEGKSVSKPRGATKKIQQKKNNVKQYRIGNARISRSNKHKSKRDAVQQFIKKHS